MFLIFIFFLLKSKGMKIILAGATGDIGSAIALSLIDKHELLLLYRDEEKRQALKGKLPKEASFLSIQECYNRLEEIKEAFINFSPDVFINAIGDGFYGKIEDIALKTMDESYEANFRVPFFLTQIAYDIFLKNRRGHIIFINSISALEGFPYGGAYCSMKFALRGLAEVVAKEGKRYGIRVTTLYLGIVDTKLLQKMPFRPKQGSLIPKEEIVKAINFALEIGPKTEIKEIILKNRRLLWR